MTKTDETVLVSAVRWAVQILSRGVSRGMGVQRRSVLQVLDDHTAARADKRSWGGSPADINLAMREQRQTGGESRGVSRHKTNWDVQLSGCAIQLGLQDRLASAGESWTMNLIGLVTAMTERARRKPNSIRTQPYPKPERAQDNKEWRSTAGLRNTGGRLQPVSHSYSPSRDGRCVKPSVTEGGVPVDQTVREAWPALTWATEPGVG